jgi:hypothetical protein
VRGEDAGAVFYVSGHGFGHATRTSEVIRELRYLRPSCRIFVRALTPREFFPHDVLYERTAIDTGVVECADGLSVDTPASVVALRGLLAQADAIIRSESAFVVRNGIDLVVADIPFLAGEIAPEVPHVAIGNFTWDWIYEPMLASSDSGLLERIRHAYRTFDRILRLPLSQPDGWDIFRTCTDVPLITRRSGRDRAEVRMAIGLDHRPAVLLGSRVAVSAEALQRAASTCPEFQFLTLASGGPDNVRYVALNRDFSFSDVLHASDFVVAKLGYSIAAECIAASKPILYPPRAGFREEEVLPAKLSEYLPATQLPVSDFAAGRWRDGLTSLATAPHPGRSTALDGAEVCASVLSETIRRRRTAD